MTDSVLSFMFFAPASLAKAWGSEIQTLVHGHVKLQTNFVLSEDLGDTAAEHDLCWQYSVVDVR